MFLYDYDLSFQYITD